MKEARQTTLDHGVNELLGHSLISIIIPTHNRAAMLERAVRSVRRQTYRPIEIVVVDDGSTDNTPQLLERLQDETPNLTVLRNAQPQGACATRNRGIRAARGKYVGLLDDDDEFTPRRVELLMQCYDQNPRWSFVCSDFLSIRRNGARRSHKPGPINLRKILWMNYATQSVITPRSYLLDIDGFDTSLTAAQDYDAFTRLIVRFGPAYRLGKPLYLYHQEHEAPRITSSTKKLRGYFNYYRKHRHLMTRQQRAYHLYRLLKQRGSRPGPIYFLKWVPLRYYPLEFNDYLIHQTNFYRYLNRLRRPGHSE